MYREGGTKAEREFHEFAQKTYNTLVEDGTASSLKLLCRLDISVMFNKGKLQYFVNEVERGVLVSLFGGVGDIDHSAEKIGDEMRDHIISLLDDWYAL
jgi:hypothetical protein